MEHYALLNGSYTHETLYNLKPVRAEGAYVAIYIVRKIGNI